MYYNEIFFEVMRVVEFWVFLRIMIFKGLFGNKSLFFVYACFKYY